jgi:hypothetical protein
MENPFSALLLFGESMDLDDSQRNYLFRSNIDRGFIDRNALIKELDYAIHDEDFNWQEILKRTQQPIDSTKYNKIELTNYVKSLLYDIIFPEKKMSTDDLNKVS